MLIGRSIGKRCFAVDPQQSVGLFVQNGTVSSNSSFRDVAAFVEWLRLGERIPGIIQWELLSTCNFKCPFCYIIGHTPKKVFNSARAIKLVDEFVNTGVIEVILTGGEPLLHPKFEAIYEKLKRSGIIVTIYSNLEILNDNHIDLLRQFPPYSVDVSIYGHDEVSYERATSRRAFTRVLNNVERLLEIGIDVLCKTPVTVLTHNSIEWIRKWCLVRSIPYVASPNIEDGLDGTSLSHFALTGQAYYTEEMFRVGFNGKQIFFNQSETRDPRCSFNCGVAKLGAYICYDGTLSPCALIRDQRYDIMNQSFADAWHQLVVAVLPSEDTPINGCNPKCRAKTICKMCPALALSNEKGQYEVDQAYCNRMITVWDKMQEVPVIEGQ